MYKQYNTNQLSLELNIAWDLPATHEARLISQFVDTIPKSVLLEETSHTGRPAFHPAMLLKMTCLPMLVRYSLVGKSFR